MKSEDLQVMIGEWAAKRIVSAIGAEISFEHPKVESLTKEANELSDKITLEIKRLYAIEDRLNGYIDRAEQEIDSPLKTIILNIFKDIRDGKKESI